METASTAQVLAAVAWWDNALVHISAGDFLEKYIKMMKFGRMPLHLSGPEPVNAMFVARPNVIGICRDNLEISSGCGLDALVNMARFGTHLEDDQVVRSRAWRSKEASIASEHTPQALTAPAAQNGWQ